MPGKFRVYLGRGNKPTVSSIEDGQQAVREYFEQCEYRGERFAHALKTEDRVALMAFREWLTGEGLTLDAARELINIGRHTASKTATASHALMELVGSKAGAGLDPGYIQRRLTQPLKHFLFFARADNRLLHMITPADCQAWVSAPKLSQSSKLARYGSLAMFFEFCMRRGYLTSSPLRSVDRPRYRRSVPDVYTPDQCREWLSLCARRVPDFLPSLVLLMFAGLRPGEVAQTGWDRITLLGASGSVDVRLEASKGRARRFVRLEPVGALWLRLLRREGYPLPYPGCWKALRRALGRKGGLAWGQDWFRHTAATHLCNLHGERETAKLLGHSERMLHAHYRQAVPMEDTKAFYALRPYTKLPAGYLNQTGNVIRLRVA